MTRTGRCFGGIVAGVLSLVSAPAFAQVGGALEAGAGRVEYAETAAFGVVSATPSVRLRAGAAQLDAAATGAIVDGDGWALQGAASGRYGAPLGHSLLLEATGLAAGSTGDGGGGSVLGQAGARLHAGAARGGAWLGGGLGGARSDGLGLPIRQLDLGAWARVGGGLLVLGVTPTWIGAGARPFTDVTAAVAAPAGPALLRLDAGLRRFGAPASRPTTAWGNLTLDLPVRGPLHVIASGGSYPEDLAQRLPRGTFVTLGLRWAWGDVARPDPGSLARLRPLPPGARPVTSAPSIERVDARLVRLVVVRPGARRVEFMGDATGWEPIALEPAGNGRWTATVPAAPGTMRGNIRVDGGAWGVPAGVPLSEDEFGGYVGLFRVP